MTLSDALQHAALAILGGVVGALLPYATPWGRRGLARVKAAGRRKAQKEDAIERQRLRLPPSQEYPPFKPEELN